MEKQLMFFVDFDGTIARQDICDAMVKTFAGEPGAELNRLWEEGRLTTVQCAERTFEHMPVKEEELRQFFSTMSIEESFLHFASWAKARSYPVYILSDGYENYIKLLLERSHLDIPYYANRLYYDQGWKISCPYPGADCSRCGVCKRDLIQKLALPQYVLIYVGDGYSDVCPAEHCDLVFAKSNLAAYRRKNQLPYCPFVSFDDILKTLDRMLEKEAPNGL